jgi:uncharacterized protein YbjT (DUF2867 family)
MILVLGASGNVGSQVVARLGERGSRARAAFHSADKAAAAALPAGITPVVVDAAEPASLRAALAGVTRLFVVSPATPDLSRHEANAIAAAQAAGVAHVVKLSIYPAHEQYTFGRAHCASETSLRQSGLAYTLVRANAYMQNFVNFFAGSIRAQGAFHLPARDARVSHIDLRDVADVIVETLTRPGHEGQAYDLTGPEAITYGEAAARLSRALGKPVTYVDVAPADFKRAMLGYGAPEWLVDGMIDYERLCIEGGAAAVTDTFARLMGKKPRSFDDFARDHRHLFG